MSEYTEKFAGCAIKIGSDNSLTIEGKFINCDYDAPLKKWSSDYLPYMHYNSVKDLARAIARDTKEFSEPNN